VPHVKFAMNYRHKNSFSMSYVSRKVIFPGVLLMLFGSILKHLITMFLSTISAVMIFSD